MVLDDCVVNLSTASITQDQLRVLGLGLSFNQKPDSTSLIHSVATLHRITNTVSNDGDLLRGAVLTGISRLLSEAPTLPLRYRIALDQLRKMTNITILPADKASKAVIMDTAQYISTAEEMLADRSTYKELTKGHPLVSRIKKFNNRLTEIQGRLPRKPNGSSSTVLERFRIHAPSEQNLAYCYFLPKEHKPHPPLTFRPIVSQVSAFMTPIFKYIAGILSPLVGTFSSSHLTNSHDFTSCLSTFYTSNPHLLSAPILSLDVQQLFINVDLPFVLSFLRKKFTDNNLQLPSGLTLDALLDLITLCCESTVFTFNGRFYQQTFGVAMGSPLACILANIMMEALESELMSKFPVQPALWVRFVDDIFVIWPHGQEHFNEFLEGLN